MRLPVLLCSLVVVVASHCSQGDCSTGTQSAALQPGELHLDAPSRDNAHNENQARKYVRRDDHDVNRLISASRFWGKRAVPDELRKASLRWGKRSESGRPSLDQIRGSSRFWGKRDVPESLRRASLRWGKRSDSDHELLPLEEFVFPMELLNPTDSAEQPSEEIMERVTKAETLRPKLAISSRLWGR